MPNQKNSFLNIFSTFGSIFESIFIWFGHTLRQDTYSYCELETADSDTVLVAHDGSLISVLRLEGITYLIGSEEFVNVQEGLQKTLQTIMSQPGHVVQVFFGYNKEEAYEQIKEVFSGARDTAHRLQLELNELFEERQNYLSSYCSSEDLYLVLWTRLKSLTKEQLKRSNKDKQKYIRKQNLPPFRLTQNLIAAIPDLRESHDSFVKSVLDDMKDLGFQTKLLGVHDAVYTMRRIADPEFTDRSWRPFLPGDKLTIKAPVRKDYDIADVLWPSLARQILPRDAKNLDLRTAQVGDRIFASIHIHLFPKDIQPFFELFRRTIQTKIPWRISFLIESDGLSGSQIRKTLSSVLSVTSSQNRLLNDSLNLLEHINLNTDDSVVKLRVSATTWAPEGNLRLLRSRSAMLARAIEGWGSCDVSELSGDAYEGYISTLLGVSGTGIAPASIAPLSDVLYMLPLFRPASIWERGAILFRSPDGKPWPYQPGSHQQTTWIDLIYARPGSGKSVLSNAINLAVCLSAGIQRLPRIAIIDIGPSSSGLISLLKDALPADKKHLVAYHRLRMRSDYSINPFDTQLGSRYPTPQERAFLVNFLNLLVTPVGADKAYDGVSDMSGLVIDELYKDKADDGNPNIFSVGLEEDVDVLLEEMGFIQDDKTTWWEITDSLFMAGFSHEALLAQRHAMPVLAEVTAICRLPAIQDLYGKIIVATGEALIHAFARMISSAVREYPIISEVTQFDLGDARVISLDLDEVARSGGDAANRQTAIMYMLARYVLARHYFLTEDNIADMPSNYRHYHQKRIAEIREDPKRIVFDEFHRTAKAQAVRDQVIQDLREGRKWKVQIALLSQALEDFDEVMVEFATSIFVMDAGPQQSVEKTATVFGLSETAKNMLRTRVHGPREAGVTFLAQFATKQGLNTQLLTATLGPIELWSLNTTAEDVNIRNQLYKRIGPKATRRILAQLFPSGTAIKTIEDRYADYKEQSVIIDEDVKSSVLESLVNEIIAAARNQQSKIKT